MSNYTVIIKKGDLQYSFSGTDKNFVLSYLGQLFFDLKNKKEKINESVQDNSAKADIIVENVVETLQENSEVETFAGEEWVESISEQKIENESGIIEEKDNLADYSAFLTPSGNIEDNKIEQISNLFDNNNDSYTFENILEEKIKNPVYEDDSKIDSAFDYEAILNMKKPESLIDYLVITAYYLLENENMGSFQLKQLNAKLFNSMKMVVDRKTMQKAVEDGLFMIVSDDDFDDGALKYALTPKGREYYINGCA